MDFLRPHPIWRAYGKFNDFLGLDEFNDIPGRFRANYYAAPAPTTKPTRDCSEDEF